MGHLGQKLSSLQSTLESEKAVIAHYRSDLIVLGTKARKLRRKYKAFGR